MKLTIKSVVIGSLLSLVLVFTFVPQIFARGGESGGTTTPSTTTTNSGPSTSPTQTSPTTSEQPSETEMSREAQQSKGDTTSETGVLENKVDNPNGELRKEVTRERLDSKKKAVCESRQTAVNKAMGNVAERSTNQLERITAIYTMSVKFYAEKSLSVSNYATLVTAVETAQKAATTANQDLATTTKFSCDSDGPKADVQAFRNKRLDKVDTFGAYRTAVKALVKAIRVAAKATETSTHEATSNSTPTGTTTGGTN
jgi:hypothetical protein